MDWVDWVAPNGTTNVVIEGTEINVLPLGDRKVLHKMVLPGATG